MMNQFVLNLEVFTKVMNDAFFNQSLTKGSAIPRTKYYSPEN